MVAPAPTSGTTANEQTATSGLNYFKKLGPIRRQNAVLGPRVQLVDHLGNVIKSGKQVAEMSIALFEALSDKPELILNGKITVPEGINLDAVKYLVSLVLALPTAKKVHQFQKFVVKDIQGRPMENVEDTFKDLHLCCAADALGMGSFTQGIFNHFFSRINTSVPPKEVIEIITAADNPTGDHLFRQMAYTMATKLHDGTFTTGESFTQHYLPTNPRLAQTIHARLTSFREIAARDAAFQAREAKRRQQQAALAFQAAAQQQYDDWKAADKAARTLAEEDDAALWKAAGESYRQKVRDGKKEFTALEAKYARKASGKTVPVGTSS